MKKEEEKTISISDIYFLVTMLIMVGVVMISFIFGIYLPYWVKLYWLVWALPLIPKMILPNGKFTNWFWTNKW